MTAFAGRREPADLVVGICGRVIVRGVAAETIFRQVITLTVAIGADERCMRPLQGEDLIVIKAGAFPCLSRIAMTNDAVRRSPFLLPAQVTFGAG